MSKNIGKKNLNTFGRDFLDLVNGTRQCHWGRHEYANGLMKLFKRFIENNPEYYIPYEEEGLIKRCARVSANLLLARGTTKITLLSFGPGTKFKAKEGALIQAFKKAGIEVVKVIYVDKYNSALNHSVKAGKKLLRNAVHETDKKDIFELTDQEYSVDDGSTIVATSFGGTSMNIECDPAGLPPVEEIENSLKSLYKKMPLGSHFISVYDHNNHKKSNELSYLGRSEHAKGILKHNLGWSHEDLKNVDYIARYNTRNYVTAHGYFFRKEMLYKLNDGTTGSVKPGTTLWFNSSVKPPKELTETMHENVGFGYLLPQKSEMACNGRMGYHHTVKR